MPPITKEDFMNNVLETLWRYSVDFPVSREKGCNPDFTALVVKLLSDHDAYSIPVSIDNVYQGLGIRLVQDDFIAQGEEEGLLGYIIAIDDGLISEERPYSIVAAVRSTDPVELKRITAGHELYHAIYDMREELRKNGASAMSIRMESTSFDENEVIANEFAAQFLMPVAKLIDAFNKLPAKSVRVLSNIFGVPSEEMVKRLRNLGITNYIDDGIPLSERRQVCDC